MSTENILKGRIAESIVEEMLKEAGFKVFRFGYEAVLQHLANIKLSKSDFYAKLVRDLPDFIILEENEHGPSLYPIEVKFRNDGNIPLKYSFEVKDPEELHLNSGDKEFGRILGLASTWRECLVIIVMPLEPYFRVYYPGKWLRKQLVIKNEVKSLEDSFPFIGMRQDIIKKYAHFVKKYLTH